MEYFWKQQFDIPDGMGYPLFGVAHLLSVAITLAIVIFKAYSFTRVQEKTKQLILKSIPIFMVILEIAKDLFLVSVHRFGVGYLPLHACSIGIFVFLLREFLPWQWAKKVFGEIAFVLIMPASLTALIFADWTIYYPVLNFINLHSYVWHGLLVLYPLLVLLHGEVSPSVKHIHYIIIFLCMVVPPIYAFDRHFRCNYFFVNWPPKDTPLEWCASFMGVPGYLIGFALMTLAVILLVYAVCWCIRRILCYNKVKGKSV